MNIKTLASGSDGNCYIVNDGATAIMLDCGIPMQEILHRTNFLENRIDGCLISHSHNDHMWCADKLMERGIDCYMSEHSYTNSGIDETLLKTRATIIEHEKEFDIGTFIIKPLKMYHDIPCLGFLIFSRETKESLFFATDTSYIPYMIPAVEYIMIETNYDLEGVNHRIMLGDTGMMAAKERLVNSHMSIDSAIRWLESTNLSKCRRIYLMHLSAGNSNGNHFKRRVIEATGIPTQIC